MIFDKITISSCFLISMFLLYNYLIFALADSILENPRLKKAYRIPVGIFNVILALICTLIEDGTALFSYFLVFIILSIEMYIFYKDSYKRTLFVTLSCLIHIMAVRSLCVAVFSIVTDLSIYQIVNDRFYFIFSMIITFILLNSIAFLVIKYLPFRRIKIINQHDDQLSFMLTWLIIFNVYFFINTQVYQNNFFALVLTKNQIIAPIAILIGLYLTLLFTMKTSDLLGYKEKNEELEQAIQNEQQYRDSMTSEAIAVYEFNLTQDRLITGFEEYKPLFGDVIYQYRYMLKIMSQKKIHPDDVDTFLKYATPENVIDEFNKGRSETVIEYRRLLRNGEYIWVKAITNLVKDTITGDIKGFTYIKDIHKKKKLELELTYKSERDSLTGLYNKGTTSRLISEYLKTNVDTPNIAALFIIDVDNFKSINDHLGHTFGDAVLCELAEKLTKIFRANDIVGRIGGDEFMVFMSDIKNIDIIGQKAKEICKAFENGYKNKNNIEYTVSSSVGIAIFPTNGTDFEELYQRSDVALYLSKNNGKNTFTMYSGESFTGYESNRTKIDTIDSLPQKNFKENKIEYVFKILYGCENVRIAVETVLKLLTSHFNFSRGYIFEIHEDGINVSNTFEWCADGIEPQIDFLQDLPIDQFTTFTSSFYETSIFTMTSLANLSQIERDVIQPQGIKAIFQIGMFEDETLMGFIGFDDCVRERNFTNAQTDEISTICRVLATFVLKQNAIEKAKSSVARLSTTMNHFNSLVYVIDKNTHEYLFMNDKMKQTMQTDGKNICCHEIFANDMQLCINCPIEKLGNGVEHTYTKEIYDEKRNLCLELTMSSVKWGNSENACLVSCIDITKYKK